MKLGQMASYLDQGLPEPVRDALAQLQHDAPPMSPELAGASVVRAELGGPPTSSSPSGTPSPIAAASIGQVHRAVTHDGRAVAVKVQYPGVDEAIRADLDNVGLLFGAIGMLFPGIDPKPLVEELRDRLIEELDYRLEAAQPAAVRRLLPRPPVHPRARRGRRPLRRPGAHHRAGRRAPASTRCWRPGARTSATWPARRSTGSSSEPLPAARLQRRPAPRQLPVRPRRAGDVPRLRAGEALRRRPRSDPSRT